MRRPPLSQSCRFQIGDRPKSAGGFSARGRAGNARPSGVDQRSMPADGGECALPRWAALAGHSPPKAEHSCRRAGLRVLGSGRSAHPRTVRRSRRIACARTAGSSSGRRPGQGGSHGRGSRASAQPVKPDAKARAAPAPRSARWFRPPAPVPHPAEKKTHLAQGAGSVSGNAPT